MTSARTVRCDRKMPCQNCIRARRATSCAYVPDDRIEPRDGTQGFNDGINGRSADKDDVVSMPFPSPHTTPASRSTLHASSTTRSNGSDAEPSTTALAERVRQLEQQLAHVQHPGEYRASGAPTRNAPLQSSKYPEAAEFIGEEYWRISDTSFRSRHANENKHASSAPVMMAKNRYFGSSHWLHGVTLVSSQSYLLAISTV